MCVFYINSLLFNQLRYVLVLFPIFTVIIFSAVYVAFKIYLKYKKNIKFSESFNVLLNKFPTKILISLLLFSAVFFVNYKRYFNFNYLLYLILISIIACLLYFVWNNKKNFLCLILMVMYSFMVTYKAPIYFMEYFGKKSILPTKNIPIEDDSVVILETLRCCFYVPFMNSKAKYIGLSLPNH